LNLAIHSFKIWSITANWNNLTMLSYQLI
jgi:hypothetical protein